MSTPHLARRRLLQMFAVGSLVAHGAPTTFAQSAPPRAGSYQPVNPVQPTLNRARIEVVDFFWYGCSHCNAFLKPLMAWKETLPNDVAYRYVPVAFDPRNDTHTRLFYTLQALDRLDLHAQVFAEIHRPRGQRLSAEEEIADFAASHNIDRKRWLGTFNGFAVQTQAKRARQVWMGYKIDGTPTLGIDGRFVTSPSMAQGHKAALNVADALIEQIRRQRSGRKS